MTHRPSDPDTAVEELETTRRTAFHETVKSSMVAPREPLKIPVMRAGLDTGLYLGLRLPTTVTNPCVNPEGVLEMVRYISPPSIKTNFLDEVT